MSASLLLDKIVKLAVAATLPVLFLAPANRAPLTAQARLDTTHWLSFETNACGHLQRVGNKRSVPILADIPLDFGQLEKHGSFVGSHAVVILSDKDDMKAVALNLMRFFEDESCGQCTPCRNGTEKAVQLMSTGNWNPELLEDLSQVMADASICGLGQAAPNPLKSVFKYFPEDLR